MSIFNNKVAVITGAGSGIGQALALDLARRGARLALSDINQAGLDETLKLLPGSCEARGYKLDASCREAVFAHAAEVQRDFGTAHVIINNAGATMVGTVANTSIEEYEWQLNLNMYGVLYGTKAFLPMLLAQREGWIVNISSSFGFIAFPAQSAYNMSKFAVRGLTECLWQELEGTGVNAVCVHPGGVKTRIGSSSRHCAAAGASENAFSASADRLLTTPPDVCATDILNGMERGKRRILTGNMINLIFWMSRLMPNSYPKVLKLLTK